MPEAKPPEAQQSPYNPPLPEPQVFEQFQGMNTSTSRAGVDDKQAWWLDGFMPIGPRLLRTMWDVAAAVYTAPAGKTVAFFDFFNTSTGTPICLAFLSDGSIELVFTATGAHGPIASAGTIQNPSRLTVGVSQYGSQYVLIVAAQANGYFVLDSSTLSLYAAGQTGPFGTVPTGISGTTVETYAGRVWIANGAVVTFSAPGSVVDFTTGSGGGIFTSSDSFLRVSYSQLRQTNGFLYLIGDSSINYISGVQTSGSPITTTFTNQNADPETGSPWPASVTVFGRNIILANASGVYVSYGAAVTKVSEALDGIYATVPNFGGLIPSAAKAIVFGKKVWMILVPIIDPINGQQVNKLFIWNSKFWWASGQSINLLYIQHQEINSVLTAWGTDGTSIYPMFQQPGTAFSKIAQSKLWDAPGGYQFYKNTGRLFGMFQYFSFSGSSVSIDISVDNENSQATSPITFSVSIISWTNNANQPIVWTNASAQVITWSTSGNSIVVMDPQAIGQNGVLSGMTAETSAGDMAIVSLMIQNDILAYRG